jgi:hypothetical protein
MPLVYRTNVPEKPRPLKPLPPDEPPHPEDAVDWKPRTLPLSTTRLLVESPDIQQPDIAAAVSQENQPMTAKKKVATRPGGVIAVIVETISRAKGASADETLEVLKKAFPERDPDGMRKTTLIQSAKNCTSKERHDQRGFVYFRRGRGSKVKLRLDEVLIRLRAAVVELTSIDEDSGGAIDLSLAIELLQRPIRELEAAH